MDFELNQDQQAILEALQGLLGQHAGPARAISLSAKAEYDVALEDALAEAGFLEIALGEETGPLEAALVVEEVARSAGVAAIGAAALVAPGTLGRGLPGPVALATAPPAGPVRYAAQARTLLVADADVARIVPLAAGAVRPVSSKFGYPLGRLGELPDGERCDPGSGERMRSWWRIALAAETAGAMRAALDCTVAYVKQRRQFGRAIGSFQAVQHRLAECSVLVAGSHWLACEAAARGAPAEAAASAAAFATAAAGRVFTETHQLSGAIGYTIEHDLHVWSMRLQALRLELDGVAGHRRTVAEARWAPTS